jgi:hypothetical protein
MLPRYRISLRCVQHIFTIIELNRWVEGRPGEAPEIAGTDFIIARDGRIAAVYLLFRQIEVSWAVVFFTKEFGHESGFRLMERGAQITFLGTIGIVVGSLLGVRSSYSVYSVKDSPENGSRRISELGSLVSTP